MKTNKQTDIQVDLTQYQNRLSLKNKLGRALWGIVYNILFRTAPTSLLNGWRIFLLRCFGAKFTGKVSVHRTAKIWAPWNLEMDTTGLSRNVNCYNVDKVIIGRCAVISEGAYLCTASHDITNPEHALITAPILVKDQAWIAVEAFIGMGVTIGQGAVVGARGCVFKDVEPWTVVGGNPAKLIKKRILQY